jgi:hypothetical protein
MRSFLSVAAIDLGYWPRARPIVHGDPEATVNNGRSHLPIN